MGGVSRLIWLYLGLSPKSTDFIIAQLKHQSEFHTRTRAIALEGHPELFVRWNNIEFNNLGNT